MTKANMKAILFISISQRYTWSQTWSWTYFCLLFTFTCKSVKYEHTLHIYSRKGSSLSHRRRLKLWDKYAADFENFSTKQHGSNVWKFFLSPYVQLEFYIKLIKLSVMRSLLNILENKIIWIQTFNLLRLQSHAVLGQNSLLTSNAAY
jgi:hypothetical protein